MSNAQYPGRLIKVLLPPKLVERLDVFINASAAYADRTAVMVDALDGFLTEATAESSGGTDDGAVVATDGTARTEHLGGQVAASTAASGVGSVRPAVETIEPAVARSLLTLRGPSRPVEPVPATPTRQDDVTWGMHNRDFPTLWAARHLLSSCESNRGAVELDAWTRDVATAANYIGDGLRDHDDWDLSGFPTSSSKTGTTRVQNRFLTFFAADPDGTGPLIDFGLAACTGDTPTRIGPTAAALDVLAALDGYAPCNGEVLNGEQRSAWIAQLRTYRPADVDLFTDIITAIAAGTDRRDALVEAVAASGRSAWSATTAATNVNGAIGRLRELGLIARRQTKGRYVLAGDADWAVGELAA